MVVAVCRQIDTVVALAEFCSIGVHEKTQMSKSWGFPTESLIEGQVLGRGNEPFLGNCKL
jgi:hypothetical protein